MSAQLNAREALNQEAAVQNSERWGVADGSNLLKRARRVLRNAHLQLGDDDSRQVAEGKDRDFCGVGQSVGDPAAR